MRTLFFVWRTSNATHDMICIGQKWWEIGSRSVPRLGKRQFGVSRVPPCVERREKEGGPFFAPFPIVHTVWKSQKKSHVTLRAKRATFTFWLHEKSRSWIKNSKANNNWVEILINDKTIKFSKLNAIYLKIWHFSIRWP